MRRWFSLKQLGPTWRWLSPLIVAVALAAGPINLVSLAQPTELQCPLVPSPTMAAQQTLASQPSTAKAQQNTSTCPMGFRGIVRTPCSS